MEIHPQNRRKHLEKRWSSAHASHGLSVSELADPNRPWVWTLILRWGSVICVLVDCPSGAGFLSDHVSWSSLTPLSSYLSRYIYIYTYIHHQPTPSELNNLAILPEVSPSNSLGSFFALTGLGRIPRRDQFFSWGLGIYPLVNLT